ncbi:MAG: fused MFS/spermidine synthase [Oscillospiraceae bacterium]
MQIRQGSVMERKWFLYMTGFFSGMSVMAIELGASRLLAPYFSSSQIVWTVIIGTIMIAMAIGNVWGGRAADKNPDPARLYARLLLAAIWTAAIPFLGKYVIAGITALLALFVTKNFLVVASFASCIALFVFPLMLLGTVTPSLMKYATVNLSDNGRTVGELEALGTIGSIIGTFLPTFVTIPTVGTARTFLIFAAILAAISLIFFISRGKKIARTAVCFGLMTVLIFMPFSYSFAFWEKDLAFEGESVYNYLQVKETDDSVILSTNVAVGVQSIRMKAGGLTGMYYDYALAAPVMAENAESLLILGLGSGTFAEQCAAYFPGIDVTGVEIDGKIVDLSREYFGLPDSVEAVVYDGRAYLRDAGLYDVIMVDAYQDITIPFQMSTVEFFTEVHEHLAPGGVMVVNMNMRSGEEGSINEYLCDTIASVFPACATVEVQSGTNMELFAGDDPELFNNFAATVRAMDAADPLRAAMTRVSESLVPVSGGGLILTDDKAPVELLGMRVLDELIAGELSYVRDALKNGSIMDLLG